MNAFDNVYSGKTILLTGHTGFKGSWLSVWLSLLGAKVIGVGLDPVSERGNYCVCGLQHRLTADLRVDLRQPDVLDSIIGKYQPEMVFHLAAQALVRTAYAEPRQTYETNVLGTLTVLEALRRHTCLHTAVMITSDKCYENMEQIWGYRETDRMGGYDPYSASKGCAELMIASYRNSYFNPKDYARHGKAVASVRAGNVIGGGDWSADRLIPDCIRALEQGRDIKIRSPHATRPWEHVLEPLSGYLRVGQKLLENPVTYAQSYNFGPPVECNKTVWEVVSYLVRYYGSGRVVDASDRDAPHENTLLSLDVTKAYLMLQWQAMFSLHEAIEHTVDWYTEAQRGSDMFEVCQRQIEAHMRKTYLWERI